MLYAVVGEGNGNKAEILRSLEDLRDNSAAKEEDFWFALHGKEDPTTTDKAILKWMQDNGVYFVTVGEEYEGAQDVHTAADPYRKMLGLLTDTKSNDEDVALLALYVDSDAEVEEDNELATLVERTVEEDIPVMLLNGQMLRLTFEEDEEAEAEGEAEAEEGEEGEVYTEDELKAMSTPELKALAKGQGVDIKGLTRKPDLIEALLAAPSGEDGEGEDVEPPAEAVSRASMLDTPREARQAAAIVIIVDGTVTTLPVSVGHARAVLKGAS